MTTKINKKNECYSCKNKRSVPNNCHIRCVKPDADMVGNEHGIAKGWFMYPFLFDPAWKEKKCKNFKDNAISDAVRNTVSESKAH